MNALPASVRVLIVDDDVDVRLALCSLLRSLGHQVEEADNGDRGLTRILAARPDLALIDLAMEGGLDGYELARQLRATPDGAALRLVALTGHSRREERVRALEAGFDRVLVKPVSEREL
ncbi:MAG: Sensor protein, partial [Myxococcaceae bacterium]|nr:Sensor protein [Myxococcaceae bacterium]